MMFDDSRNQDSEGIWQYISNNTINLSASLILDTALVGMVGAIKMIVSEAQLKLLE
jgi:hypothetical protein